jgi:hypothetical protein
MFIEVLLAYFFPLFYFTILTPVFFHFIEVKGKELLTDTSGRRKALRIGNVVCHGETESRAGLMGTLAASTAFPPLPEPLQTPQCL